MQRWIIVALLGAILFGVGGGYALWTYRQNRPDKMYVQFPLNEEFPEEKQKPLAEEIKRKLLETSLDGAIEETRLAAKLRISADEAKKQALQGFFVDVGDVTIHEAVPPKRLSTIDVGFRCQRKSRETYGELAMRLMKDVYKMLGVKDPQDDAI